ncbi:hypothetical protein ACJ72_07317 [Emergomyces africanus]|uniref:Septin-type G domain-containing protein n=1 Tax=Emergomyces africanus TaxID=1955775 RepID=A0A1B7NNX7_9EURO|nr:hypothetical protein ACJ72_07317 [Emergomyces africanus]
MRPVVADTFIPRPRKSASPAGGEDEFCAASPETFFLTRDSNIQDPQITSADDEGEDAYGVQSLEESIAASSKLGASPKWPESQPGTEMDDTSLPPVAGKMEAMKIVDTGDADREGQILRWNLPPSQTAPSRPRRGPFDQLMKHQYHTGGLAKQGGKKMKTTALHRTTYNAKYQNAQPEAFTEKGKSMGRFKILVTGAAGCGKTSLIKSLVQVLEDIVHVDPLPRTTSRAEAQRANKSSPKRSHRTHNLWEPPSIVEIYASTKPYPSWWSDLEDSRVLRRRKSIGDFVLERNLCFVDTGCETLDLSDQAERIVQYIHQQFQRAVNALDSINTDFQGLLSGNGGSQVDAILYLVSADSMSADISCIQKLSKVANVIPLISKADLLSESQIHTLKRSFLARAQEAGVRPFLFGELPDGAGDDETIPCLPFAVSSANSNDDDTMDASLLMSPDYLQPLAPSDLNLLLEKLFDRDNMAWLRHLAAKKLIQACDLHSVSRAHPHGSSSPIKARFSSNSSSQFTSSLSSASPSQVLVPYPGAYNGPPSYTMSRVADHTQREEHLAQIRLAKWASDLQQSLQNERDRYEALARGERAVWLTERLGECVADGTLLPITQTSGFPPSVLKRRGETVTVLGPDGQPIKYRVTDMSSLRDPLGLIQWKDDVRRTGWVLMQVIGSMGVVGGLALWVAKAWGFTSQDFAEWNVGWLSGE